MFRRFMWRLTCWCYDTAYRHHPYPFKPYMRWLAARRSRWYPKGA